MQSTIDSSESRGVYRHRSGAEIRVHSVGYAAMHGEVRVEGSTQDERIYLNGYHFKRGERPPDQPPPQVSHPWPTVTLSRTDLAEVCDVFDRDTTGDPFDYAGVEAGHLYFAYDADPDSLFRDMGTEERVYAVPAYQTSLIESPISHLSARGTGGGSYRLYGYNPEGPSAEEHTL